MGDEGHNRNKAGSLLFLKALAPHLAAVAPDDARPPRGISQPRRQRPQRAQPGDGGLQGQRRRRPRRRGHAPSSRPWPATAPISASASAAWASSWFTAPLADADGLYFPGFSSADANADIGDSTITETAGIGGFAMASAPAIVTFVSGTPEDAVNATLEMYEITVAEHKHFTMPALDFRGTPTGIDIRKVVEKDITPRINTGIAHKNAGVGQIGAGLVRPPMAIFEAALVAFAERYGY